jgi:hypothetical protein
VHNSLSLSLSLSLTYLSLNAHTNTCTTRKCRLLQEPITAEFTEPEWGITAVIAGGPIVLTKVKEVRCSCGLEQDACCALLMNGFHFYALLDFDASTCNLKTPLGSSHFLIISLFWWINTVGRGRS